MNTWLAVFVGGGLGSVVRYAMSLALGRWFMGAVFPWATLASNVLATAIMGLLVWRFALDGEGKELWWTLLAVGFCGGFSTFSTFSVETIQLMREGFTFFAWLNILVSVSACLLILHLIARAS
ncbi:MAG: fluoride efflux transporter CrcB [Flavobacteriales bacterium]